MPHPPGVGELLDSLLAGLRAELGELLVGVYLRGSLALGDFIPETSDVDVLVVVERPLSASEFDALGNFHTRLGTSDNAYAQRLEVAYLDRASAWTFTPGQTHATLGQGESLAWTEHRTNWVLERWTVREHGVVLYGPDPQSLIDPISSDDVVDAVRARLPDWAAWLDQRDAPDWLRPRRSFMAYLVETMCRCLYVLARGEIPSKRAAVEWALDEVPAEWRGTIERSRAWRADPTVDFTIVPEVRQFVDWATTPEMG